MLKKTLLLTLTISAIASLSISQPAYAQINEFKLTASDAAAGDNFGKSVSISGDYAVVGAFADDDSGSSSGSAYIFKRTGESWEQEAKLLASDGAAGDNFGESVSISGDYAVVGARFDDDNGSSSGSAYVFKRTGTSWAQETKLLPSDGAANDWFGVSVSISGDYAVVGARLDDDNGTNSGSVYVFKRTGTSWAQEAKLLASDGAANDQFGVLVSISGDYAVVGAWWDDDNGTNSGSAYIFKRSGTSWAQETKLLPSDGAASDFFGVSVSISGDYAVVGAFQDDDNGTNSGSTYLFKRTGTSWAEEAKLLPSDGAADDQFGNSVSISGDYAVVGALDDDDNGSNSGSAYLFKRAGTSWTQEAKLTASDGAAADQFGFSVSISGEYAVVGALRDDDNGTDSGSAYLTTISPVLSFSSDSLDFSTVFIGFPASKQLIVTNSGVDSLFISDISSDNAVFTIDVTSSDLGAGGRDTITVTFSPVSVGSFTGELTFASNDFRDPLKTVALTGNALVAPVMSVTPDSIEEVLVVGDSASHFVTIDNSAGGSDLIWEAFTFQAGGAFVVNSSPAFVNEGESIKSKFDDRYKSVKTPQSLIYRSEKPADILPRLIQSTSSGADERSLEFILDHLNLNFKRVTDAIPLIFHFSDGVVGYDINDGGNDMYDGGNIISTDLGGPIDYSDDLIIDHTVFGAGGMYFTRKYPGLFVLVADLDSISNFDINGNNGADGDGSADGAILQLNKAGITYTGFVKRVFSAGDPSINHLVIVEQLPDVGHEFSFDTNNDYHRVFNLEANRRLYYLLYAGSGGTFINNETTLRIMDAFLEAIDPLRWIRLTPESGIVAAGASSTMEVFLDGRLLTPADYRGNIGIRSNDPESTENRIPVRFKVLPSPIDPPVITSIDDVPDDQGGWVTVSWNASSDDNHFSPTPVEFYSIWLRDNSADGVSFDDNEVLLRRVEKSGSDVMTVVTKKLRLGEENFVNADVKSLELLNMAGDIENEITMPAMLNRFMSEGGSWIGIGTIGATQDTSYTFLVHTLVDSNDAGINWSHLKISAHPENPFTFSFSQVDSGYSVDNLSPAVPTGLSASITGEGSILLAWDAPVDADFDYFGIYKSTESGFDPSGLEPYSESIDTFFIDSEVTVDSTYYYRLSAVDFNGNESEFSEEVNATIIGIEEERAIPDEFSLAQNYPNPFNPSTVIKYALPKSSSVSLVIYNMMGQEIRRWDESDAVPGYYEKIWNGTTQAGVPVSSGIYIYRLTTAEFIQMRKMVLLK